MLIDVALRELGYTNADAQTVELVEDLLGEGKSFLDPYCDGLDYEGPTLERGLVIEYARYSLSNARDDFSKNYRNELLRLSNRGRVARYASSQTEQNDQVQSGSAPVSESEPE